MIIVRQKAPGQIEVYEGPDGAPVPEGFTEISKRELHRLVGYPHSGAAEQLRRQRQLLRRAHKAIDRAKRVVLAGDHHTESGQAIVERGMAYAVAANQAAAGAAQL